MNREIDNQRKWEQWAADLHQEESCSADYQSLGADSEIVQSLRKIQSAKEQVGVIQQFQPVDQVWNILKVRMVKKIGH